MPLPALGPIINAFHSLQDVVWCPLLFSARPRRHSARLQGRESGAFSERIASKEPGVRDTASRIRTRGFESRATGMWSINRWGIPSPYW